MYSSKLQIRLGNRYGFTLIELMFVIVILGVLASIVLGQFRDMTGDAGKSAFMTSGRIFTQAAMRFHLDNGEYPENAGSGVLPAGFGSYVQANRWEGGTPIGGVWDSENNSFGIVSAVGVHFDAPTWTTAISARVAFARSTPTATTSSSPTDGRSPRPGAMPSPHPPQADGQPPR
jgi:prepilin-type N-terminal cleavage/methylation domain-containing protein